MRLTDRKISFRKTVTSAAHIVKSMYADATYPHAYRDDDEDAVALRINYRVASRDDEARQVRLTMSAEEARNLVNDLQHALKR